ncbi:MAG: hypothetical protein KDA20_12795 [Phycisphaerales bacterium]|nr:hypothetical protein [Phycisphaerales bacterium]
MSSRQFAPVAAGAALCAAALLIGPTAGLEPAFAGPIIQSTRPVDQPIVLSLPRDHGRSLVLNADPSPGDVGQATGGRETGNYVPNSPLPYGADPAQAGVLIFVRTREPLPPIAISPWEEITQEHVAELLRTRPWIRRGDSILQDLRSAQAQWLREHGYTGVRTIVGEGERDVPTVVIGVGSGVTILSPDAPGAKEALAEAAKAPTPETLGLKRDSIIRVRRAQ